MIGCSNPLAQYQSHRGEIREAIDRVLERGRYILGEEVQAFEKEFSAYIGVEHGIGVASGTDAIHLALVALGVGAGDEVITPSHTAVATAAAIRMAGGIPVFVDIEPVFFTLDLAAVEAAITPRTKAIVAVHLYGQSVDMVPLVELAHARGIKVVEDCAQCHGARLNGHRLGSIGDIACFSFYPTKNLGALGDGGMVLTDASDLASRVRSCREYGWGERYVSATPGWNSRLDELQAAILRIKLRALDQDNAHRAQLASLYQLGLVGLGIQLPATRAGATHVYHLYVIRSSRRDALRQYLADQGIGALVHYPLPIHLQPAYRDCRMNGNLSQTEQAAREILSLPMYPELGKEAAGEVVKAIRTFSASNHIERARS